MTAPSRAAAIVEDEAARWLLRREEVDWTSEDQVELDRWLDASMAHRAAFWRLELGWSAADRVAALGSYAMPERWWRQAVAKGASLRRGMSRRMIVAAAASLLLFVAATAAFRTWVVPTAEPLVAGYQTQRGMQRAFTLNDGSRVEMNTATQLRVSRTGTTREVWLEEGEAFFDVVHRADRPFVVHAGARTITVLGTRFSVRREGAEVTVAVVSGRVRVDDAQARTGVARNTVVSGGGIAFGQRGQTLVEAGRPVRVAAMTAWRDGMIVFEDLPLSQAAIEFNRYAAKPLRIADPSIGRLRIGGSFRTDDQQSFVSLLNRAYGIHVREAPDAIVLDR